MPPPLSPLLLLASFLLPAPFLAAQDPEEAPAAVLQEPASLPPAGYLSPDELLEKIRALNEEGAGGAAGPVEVLSLAHTPGGREVLAAGFGLRDAPGRPAILVVADPDGDRPVASRTAFDLCKHLVERGSPLLEKAAIFVIPVVNPDAAARAFSGLAPRRGAPLDEDRDGRSDEDGPSDLDGDGQILSMRVPDPTGGWRAGDQDARAVVKADPDKGEIGVWRVLPEGRDEDGDHRINEDPPGGVTLERNWPHRWKEHAPPAGLFPLSEPETRGLADFVLSHPHLLAVLVLGARDNLADPPKGISKPDPLATAPLKEDAVLLSVLGHRLQEGRKLKPKSASAPAGNFADWAYFQAGLAVLEGVVWSPPLEKEPAQGAKDSAGKDRPEAPPSEEEKLLRWNDAVYGGAGFAPWKPWQHPDLGPVEIGGWKPLVLKNPPAGELEDLAGPWRRLLDSLAGDLPHMAWEKVEVRDLGAETREVRATLVNERLFPTATAMGVRTRRPLPVRIVLELPQGATLLAGLRIQSVPRLAGSGGNHAYRWVFRLEKGSPPAVLRALSQTAGDAVRKLEVNR